MTNLFDEIYGGSKCLAAAEVGSNTLRVKIGSVEPADLRQQDGTTKCGSCTLTARIGRWC
jgi:hypothetical protein